MICGTLIPKKRKRGRNRAGGDGYCRGQYRTHAQDALARRADAARAHATCLVNQSMYLHGGYGGGGFARKDFGDLHSLDLRLMCGRSSRRPVMRHSPELRGRGHQLLCVEDRVGAVFPPMGGWNANRQFDDVHASSLAETKCWSQPESASGEENFGPPRWNFTAVSVFAVPFWKIFLFGGADSASSSNLNMTWSRRREVS